MSSLTAPTTPPAAAPSAAAERLHALGVAVTPALAALVLTVVLFSAAVGLAGYDPFEVWGQPEKV